LYRVQEKLPGEKWRISDSWRYSLGYGRTWYRYHWVVADADDLAVGIWGV
jgi:hypothetical protein